MAQQGLIRAAYMYWYMDPTHIDDQIPLVTGCTLTSGQVAIVTTGVFVNVTVGNVVSISSTQSGAPTITLGTTVATITDSTHLTLSSPVGGTDGTATLKIGVTSALTNLADAGFNRALIKFFGNPETETLERQRWATFAERSTTCLPVPMYNWNDGFNGPRSFLERYADPLRRYEPTSSHASKISTMACPIDPRHIRAMLIQRYQQEPRSPRIGIDPEFYGSPAAPGGFHNYVTACFCNPCRVDWWRSVNNITGTPVTIDPATITLPSAAVLLAFEQTRRRTLVAEAAAQAYYTEVHFFDQGSDDTMHASLVAGLRDAGKMVTVYTERTYSTGTSGLAAAQTRYALLVASCTLGTTTTITTTNSFAGVAVGDFVVVSSGTGTVPALATVATIVSSTNITLSAATTAGTATLGFSTLNPSALASPVIMGLQLKYWPTVGNPGNPPNANNAISVEARATAATAGYWIFTSYSLWVSDTSLFALGQSSDDALDVTYSSQAVVTAAQTAYWSDLATANAA